MTTLTTSKAAPIPKIVTCPLPFHVDGFGRRACQTGGGKLPYVRWVLRRGDPAIKARLEEHLTWYTTAALKVIACEATVPGSNTAGESNSAHYIGEMKANQAIFVPAMKDVTRAAGWYLPNVWLIISATSNQAQFLINDAEQVLAARQCEYGRDNGAAGQRLLTLAEFLGHGYRYMDQASTGGLNKVAKDLVTTRQKTLDDLLNPKPATPEAVPVEF